MGLLRKAAGQPSVGGLPPRGSLPPRGGKPPVGSRPPAGQRPAAAPRPAAGRRGLLGRTLGIIDSPFPGGQPPAHAPAAEDGYVSAELADIPVEDPSVSLAPPVREVRMAAQLADELRTALSALPDSVELPSRLFTLISAKLGVGKGALLLYDALRLVYAPWASQGYDQTTLHRLRIPLGAADSFNALANGDPLLLADPSSLAPYQPFFSSREFSALAQVFLAPFISADRLVVVLLLSEVRSSLPGPADVLACLKVVSEAGSPRVDSAREKRLATAGLAAVQAPASLEEQAARFLQARGETDSPAVFLTLSVEEYAHVVLAGHPHLDPFRLYEDIRHFLGAFVADTGAALPVRPGVFIVGLRSLDAEDIDLFTHQLGQYLEGLFGPGGAPALKVLKSRSWPADGNDIRSLLDHLAS